ncbi:MAG: GNAT family N-acetyltransferase [Thermoguttaceae bacterium]|nr:GNAT family N-acetyltransferase [Thermoguttaceae bacterium]
MNDLPLQYDIANLNDIDGIVDCVKNLTHLHYFTAEAVKSIVRWRFFDCPLLSKPLMLVCRHDNDIVGTLGYFPALFESKGRAITVACPSYVYVKPEYRRQGIYTELLKYSYRFYFNDLHFILATENVAVGSVVQEKAGFWPFGIKERCRRIQWLPMLRYMFLKAISPNCLINEVNNQLVKPSRAIITDKEKILDVYEELTNHFQFESSDEILIPYRTRDYMQWRINHPARQYVLVPYFQKNQIQSAFLCSISHRNVDIVDFISSNDDNFPKNLNILIKKIHFPRIVIYTAYTKEKYKTTLLKKRFSNRDIWSKFKKPRRIPNMFYPMGKDHLYENFAEEQLNSLQIQLNGLAIDVN